jgi:lambda repressor-like predicted transcriptional regulator
MPDEDDFWALATRLVDKMCESCPDCGHRKLENAPCDSCSPPPRPGVLRAKPLQDELARRQKRGDLTWEQLAKDCGLSSRTILRIFAADWVTLKVADRVAYALGLHPTHIWGPEWGSFN